MQQPTKNFLKDQLALAAEAIIESREVEEINVRRIAELVSAGYKPRADNHRWWDPPQPWWRRLLR